ncbi:caspase family protein [Streptomyces sp. SID3343]|uniref:caspase family protein n=1 Tax=Streptomyces sp. SID3343 TaxID=2690260 RepID=UPI001367CCEF|nr:caspase family protein [Streptomyces sp. SID3343]MYV97243.1 hypothetical protein [Streptomyces sp. SID3343]
MVERRYHAMLIGNANYPRDSHALPALHGPLIDIGELRRGLTDRRVGLFRPDDVLSLSDSGVHRTREQLDGFFSRAVRDDVLLLYYSGHGQLDERGGLYLCAADTLVDSLRSTALSAPEINSMIEGSAAATVVIVLDCCHSGAFKTATDLAGSVAGRGRYVIASNRSTQLARAAAAPGQPSPFTAALVRGLRHAEAGGHHLTVAELYRQVHRWMTEHTSLAPQLRFAGEGEVIIAKRPGTSPRTLPRPKHLPQAAARPHSPRSRPAPPAPRTPVAEQETGQRARSERDVHKVRYRLWDPVYHRWVGIAGIGMGLALFVPPLVIPTSGPAERHAMLWTTVTLGMFSLHYHVRLHRKPLTLLITDDFLRVRQGRRSRDYDWAEISRIDQVGKSTDKHATFKLYDSAGDLVESTPLPVITRYQWKDFTEAVYKAAPHITVQDRLNSR